MMRIGVVTTSYPRLRRRSRRQLRRARTSRALRALGHDVEVIAARRGPAIDGRRAPRRRAPAVLSRRRARRARATRLPRGARRGARSPRGSPPPSRARAHALGRDRRALARAVGARRAAAPRAPLLAIAHGGDVYTLRRLRLLGPVLHALARARRAARRSSASELRAIARDAAPAPRRLARRRDRPADGHRPRALRRARRARRRARRRSLVVARLVPIKGVDVALAALAHVRAPAQLVIAGDGPERAPARASRAHRRARFARRGRPPTPRSTCSRRASVVVVPSRVLAERPQRGHAADRARGARRRRAGRRIGGRRAARARAAASRSSLPTIRARSPPRSIASSPSPPTAGRRCAPRVAHARLATRRAATARSDCVTATAHAALRKRASHRGPTIARRHDVQACCNHVTIWQHSWR